MLFNFRMIILHNHLFILDQLLKLRLVYFKRIFQIILLFSFIQVLYLIKNDCYQFVYDNLSNSFDLYNKISKNNLTKIDIISLYHIVEFYYFPSFYLNYYKMGFNDNPLGLITEYYYDDYNYTKYKQIKKELLSSLSDDNIFSIKGKDKQQQLYNPFQAIFNIIEARKIDLLKLSCINTPVGYNFKMCEYDYCIKRILESKEYYQHNYWNKSDFEWNRPFRDRFNYPYKSYLMEDHVNIRNTGYPSQRTERYLNVQVRPPIIKYTNQISNLSIDGSASRNFFDVLLKFSIQQNKVPEMVPWGTKTTFQSYTRPYEVGSTYYWESYNQNFRLSSKFEIALSYYIIDYCKSNGIYLNHLAVEVREICKAIDYSNKPLQQYPHFLQLSEKLLIQRVSPTNSLFPDDINPSQIQDYPKYHSGIRNKANLILQIIKNVGTTENN